MVSLKEQKNVTTTILPTVTDAVALARKKLHHLLQYAEMVSLKELKNAILEPTMELPAFAVPTIVPLLRSRLFADPLLENVMLLKSVEENLHNAQLIPSSPLPPHALTNLESVILPFNTTAPEMLLNA
jgi:hypothetical protein